MAVYTEIHSNEELDQVWEKSRENPVLLFKHSTTCPISAEALRQYESFLDTADEDVSAYLVKVIEDRPVSNQIAEKTNVKHESPQIFLIRNNEAEWNTSHSKITKDSIKEALRN